MKSIKTTGRHHPTPKAELFKKSVGRLAIELPQACLKQALTLAGKALEASAHLQPQRRQLTQTVPGTHSTLDTRTIDPTRAPKG